MRVNAELALIVAEPAAGGTGSATADVPAPPGRIPARLGGCSLLRMVMADSTSQVLGRRRDQWPVDRGIGSSGGAGGVGHGPAPGPIEVGRQEAGPRQL